MFTVFFSSLVAHVDGAVAKVVDHLQLVVDDLPGDFPYDFSAQIGRGSNHLLVELKYGDSIGELPEIEEITSEWEYVSEERRNLLLDCKASLLVHYRDIKLANRLLLLLAEAVGPLQDRCVVKNGHGCLLLLSEMTDMLRKDPDWSWEKQLFPELPGVAPSEWLEDEIPEDQQ
jgi:hypothetical protein